MYEIKRPEIVLLQKNANGQMEEYKRFASENELVNFLARFHKPILSWDGNPIPGLFQNNYVDFQCLSGTQIEKGYRHCGVYSSYIYHTFDEIWTPYLYQFYLNTPGHPLYDVRNLEAEVRKAYCEKQKQKPKRRTRLQMLEEWKKWSRTKQGRKGHTCYNKSHHSYIRDVAKEVGLMYDDDEYHRLAKPKMLSRKYFWSDDSYTRRSSGWKEGNKYRKQWERGAVRNFKKEAEKTQPFSGMFKRTKLKKEEVDTMGDNLIDYLKSKDYFASLRQSEKYVSERDLAEKFEIMTKEGEKTLSLYECLSAIFRTTPVSILSYGGIEIVAEDGWTFDFLEKIKKEHLIVYDGESEYAARIIPEAASEPDMEIEILNVIGRTMFSSNGTFYFSKELFFDLSKVLHEAYEYWEEIAYQYVQKKKADDTTEEKSK